MVGVVKEGGERRCPLLLASAAFFPARGEKGRGDGPRRGRLEGRKSLTNLLTLRSKKGKRRKEF